MLDDFDETLRCLDRHHDEWVVATPAAATALLLVDKLHELHDGLA